MAYLDSTQCEIRSLQGNPYYPEKPTGFMRNGPSRRASGFTESVIREMTRLCIQHGAVNLAQGFPDFDPPLSIKRAAAKAIYTGHNQYSTPYGTTSLRNAVARKVNKYNRIPCTPDDITVTCGTTEAMIASE